MEIQERVFWSACPRCPISVIAPRTSYTLTDLRILVRRRGRIVHEIALGDIADVELRQTWRQRLAATSTVRVRSKRAGRWVALREISHGPQLALVLQMMSAEAETNGFWCADAVGPAFIERALSADSPLLAPSRHGVVTAATAACLLLFVVAGVTQHSTLTPVTYGADDPIAPNGNRRSMSDIAAFMEAEVMPFARRALGPVVGSTNVACETCHGQDARARGWQMPGVGALPEPEVRFAGMERTAFPLDPQIRNAIYGYLAEEDKLPTAAYMRAVVMPGMAKVMRRPAYDFTKTYSYNRSRVAVGCYHCHRVR
jgi:hypothetical protein